MTTTVSPTTLPILPFGPSSADVSWLNSEGDYLNTVANAVAFIPTAVAEAKEGEAALAAANHQTSPTSFTLPSQMLQNIANTASHDRLLSDATRLKTISTQLSNMLTQSASQVQQIASLRQQLAALQGSGGTPITGGNPTTTTTTTTTGPASSVSTGAVIAGIAAVAALGAGAWWYMEDQKKKQGLPLKRRA